jgi:hypothetical protein
MSGQSYLDTIERRTGLTPRQLIAQAHAAGLTADTRAGEIGTWFKTQHSLGHGHAMTMAQVLRHLESIDVKNADTTPEPPGSIGRLWLDGIAGRPW